MFLLSGRENSSILSNKHDRQNWDESDVIFGLMEAQKRVVIHKICTVEYEVNNCDI